MFYTGKYRYTSINHDLRSKGVSIFEGILTLPQKEIFITRINFST